ncbi:hypothetical protein chiPu_0029013, partial [Chiloscyllium punctatum]|nr:hypothetical protein [Chiloscyllium punctatum]
THAQFGFYGEHAQCHIDQDTERERERDMELLSPAAAAIGFRERRSEPVCGSLAGRKERRDFTSTGYRLKITRKRPSRPV